MIHEKWKTKTDRDTNLDPFEPKELTFKGEFMIASIYQKIQTAFTLSQNIMSFVSGRPENC